MAPVGTSVAAGAHLGAPLAFGVTPPVLFDERIRPMTPFEPGWSLHPTVIIGTALLGALYFWGIGPWRRRHGHPPAPAWRIALFKSIPISFFVGLLTAGVTILVMWIGSLL